jgi:hypothetical protein
VAPRRRARRHPRGATFEHPDRTATVRTPPPAVAGPLPCVREQSNRLRLGAFVTTGRRPIRLRRRARALVALPNPSSTVAIAGRRSAGPDVSLIACGLAQAPECTNTTAARSPTRSTKPTRHTLRTLAPDRPWHAGQPASPGSNHGFKGSPTRLCGHRLSACPSPCDPHQEHQRPTRDHVARARLPRDCNPDSANSNAPSQFSRPAFGWFSRPRATVPPRASTSERREPAPSPSPRQNHCARRPTSILMGNYVGVKGGVGSCGLG